MSLTIMATASPLNINCSRPSKLPMMRILSFSLWVRTGTVTEKAEIARPWDSHQTKVIQLSQYHRRISQTYPALLADAIFELGKPVVLVLQGGRPFAIPEYYEKSAATLNAVRCLSVIYVQYSYHSVSSSLANREDKPYATYFSANSILADASH